MFFWQICGLSLGERKKYWNLEDFFEAKTIKKYVFWFESSSQKYNFLNKQTFWNQKAVLALNNWPFGLFKRRHFYSWHHESDCGVLLQGASFNLILECLDCETLLQGASQPRLRDDLLISKRSSIFMAILDSRAIIFLFQNYWSQNYNFVMPHFWNSNFFYLIIYGFYKLNAHDNKFLSLKCLLNSVISIMNVWLWK